MGGRSRHPRVVGAVLPLLIATCIAAPGAAASPPPPPPPELWVMDADGTNQRRVAEDAVFGSGAAWSPDATEIAYGAEDTNPGGRTRLVVVTVDSPAPPRFLTYGSAPEWAPDGSAIAFVDYQASVDLFVISPDGTGRIELAGGPGNQSFPVWSPDSSRIAFLDHPEYRPDEGPQRPSLVVIDADGTDRRVVPTPAVISSRPAWSPDASEISYAGAAGDIHVVDLATGAERNVTRDHRRSYSSAWAPSDRIAYSDEEGVWVVEPDGSGKTFVHRGFIGQWMPGGDKLLFSFENDVYVTQPGAPGTTNLTGTPDAWEYAPVPSPDGRSIAYRREPAAHPPRTYDRAVSASLGGRRVAGRVTAEDGYSRCVSRKKLVLQRFGAGGWRSIDSKRTDVGGTFSWRIPARDGFYRVHAPLTTDRDPWAPALCAAASSPPLRYRR